MAGLRPPTSLENGANHPPPFEDINLFATDTALEEALKREGGAAHEARVSTFGARVGSAEFWSLAAAAHRHVPELRTFDRYGRRIDEIDYHPAYHQLMREGIGAGISGAAWSGLEAGHVLHAALEFLLAEVEPSVCCPITMTYAAPAALKHAPDAAREWMPRILAQVYDPSSRPAMEKSGATIGMAMTEKQGGSDVRANTTRAERASDGAYVLTGHKWFCSAPMSDAFLTLAQAEGGLTCFLAPRWRPDGERNAIHIMRLKEKIGDRANASSEIEYHGAYAMRIGDEGRGIATILEMVHHTRLDCAIAPAAYMRSGLAQAIWHASHRSAFGKRLIDQPLMRQVLADLAIETEAATALAFRIARSFDEARANEDALPFSRIATPVAKYWLNKRVVGHVAECMECHGGAGYTEEWPIARLYRQAPLNGIWEGSGNVICLDVLRALKREPRAGEAFLAELRLAAGPNPHLDRTIKVIEETIAKGGIEEQSARRIVETMAKALQASLLLRHAPTAAAEAFCASRLGDDGGAAYGSLKGGDIEAILRRASPI
ncbi:MAG TPA: acyl-CoA dehydrogenase family protein [Micropepsaceae bacterium]|nr:acyl-CoA dehydrogenase family protein [Micropepsaceae bacterium]